MDKGPAQEVTLLARTRGPWSIVFWAFVALASAWLAYVTVVSIAEAASSSLWIAAGLGVLTLVFVVVLGRALVREIGAYRRTDALAERAEAIARAIQENDVRLLLAILAPTLDGIRLERPELVAEFESAARLRGSCGEVLDLLENVISTDLDRAADREIKSAALKIGLAVAIIPHPALDAAVILWRATALSRRLGEIYGLNPTGLSSLRLLKYAITSAMIGAAVETTSEALVDELGRSIATRAGKGFAEGSVTAMRVYRLGQLTKRICRL